MRNKIKKTIWLNQWFSSAYHIVTAIREDERFSFYIIGSSKVAYSPVRCVCDEWYVEPEYSGDDDYLAYCLMFCKQHGIDIFIPHRGISICTRHCQEFEAAGVLVLVENDRELFDICNNKITAYNHIAAFFPECVPEFTEIYTRDEFIESYNNYSAKHERVCFKAAIDEGAASFQIFDGITANALRPHPEAFKAWIDAVYAHAVAAIPRHKESSLLMMPYLASPEVSVDALYTPQGFIFIPRRKMIGRQEIINPEDEVIPLCKTLLEHIPLRRPCNLQFRYCGGIPYLLEINTRMSGGIGLSYIGTGINIPNIAVNQMLGIDKPWTLKNETVSVSYVESPLFLEKT
jgi:hypothetical protein